jgi:hypothetical protein
MNMHERVHRTTAAHQASLRGFQLSLMPAARHSEDVALCQLGKLLSGTKANYFRFIYIQLQST